MSTSPFFSSRYTFSKGGPAGRSIKRTWPFRPTTSASWIGGVVLSDRWTVAVTPPANRQTMSASSSPSQTGLVRVAAA